MRSSSRVSFQGIRKIGFCHGSLVCPNTKCGFLSTSHQGQPNMNNWKTRRDKRIKSVRFVIILQQKKGCGARKLVEYLPSEETAYVYHIGNHKCHMKLKVQSKQEAIKRKAQGSTQRTGLAKRMAIEEIETLVGEGRMDEAADEADSWVDARFAKRVSNEAKKHDLDVVGEDNKSFDAVVITKK